MFKRFLTTSTILICIILAMFLFIASMIGSYLKLQFADPLENIQVEVVQPVYQDQDLLEFVGKYDRAVECSLMTFRLELTNIVTNDIITLTPKHIVKAPIPNKGPGKDLEIEFTLAMPSTIYPGRWKPNFWGQYLCKNGIFVAYKDKNVSQTPPFVVKKPQEN